MTYLIEWRRSSRDAWRLLGTERRLDTYRGMRAATRKAHRLVKLAGVQARPVRS